MNDLLFFSMPLWESFAAAGAEPPSVGSVGPDGGVVPPPLSPAIRAGTIEELSVVSEEFCPAPLRAFFFFELLDLDAAEFLSEEDFFEPFFLCGDLLFDVCLVGSVVVCSVGSTVGSNVGNTVGILVGFFVGVLVGAFVGALVGAFVGAFVGALVGALVGAFVGFFVGAFVGDFFT